MPALCFQERDYFGRTVNIAARIGDYAKPGEVVVSREVVDSVRGEPIAFEEIGPSSSRESPGRSICSGHLIRVDLRKRSTKNPDSAVQGYGFCLGRVVVSNVCS
jgi:hypothetical protein